MKYFTRECAVPAAAVTYAGLLSSLQPILFTTQYGYRDSAEEVSNDNQTSEFITERSKYEGRPLVWCISFLRVTLVRDWGTSICNISLTSSIPDLECDVPSLPDLSKIRGGNHPYLTVEDEIRVYAGYIDSISTPITADMLDEHPIDLCPPFQDEGASEYLKSCKASNGETFRQNPKKPLCPIFWGFIDNINIVANDSGGIVCNIQCRDRSRVFADTKIIAIPSLQGNLLDHEAGGRGTFKKYKAKDGLATGKREDILIQTARAATGRLYSGADFTQNEATATPSPAYKPCWKPVIGGGDETPDNHYSPKWLGGQKQLPQADLGVQLFTSYKYDQGTLMRRTPIEDPALWIREAMFKKMLPHSEPRFHMWVQRPPLQKASGSAVFQVLNKSPLEIIQFLANTEERPTDFYASHVNGDFIFGPRVLDTSGFYDPARFHRTYFFRKWPKEFSKQPPAPNQMIKSIRAVTSSLATFNRFVVLDSQTDGGNDSFIENLRVAIDTLPWSLDGSPTSEFAVQHQTQFPSGRAIYPPCKNQIIYDGNLSSYGSNDFSKRGGALIVAISQARTWAREMNSVQLSLLGDPTLYPNEAIRVYNTILHDYSTSIHPGTPEGIRNLERIQNQLEDLATERGRNRVESIINAEPDTRQFTTTTPEGTRQFEVTRGDEQLNTEFQTNDPLQQEVNTAILGGRVTTSSLILPVYKIRSVEHTITTTGRDKGFTTKVECISDY